MDRTLRPCGRDALLVEIEGPDALVEVERVRALLRAGADDGSLPGLVEIVPAARTVLVVAEPGHPGALDAVRARLDGPLPPAPAADPAGGAVELGVHYDGEDLDLVADAAGVDAAEVVTLHTGADLVVAFGGFAPGFAYLAGLPAPLHQARLATPRTRIPAGAVGIAGGFGGVYPRASPGGWRLIGRLADDAPVLFDPDRDPPALLTAGVRVRFRDAG